MDGVDLAERNWTEQLMQLKDLTRKLGCLHGAQIDQLKLWLYLACEHVRDFEIHFDFNTRSVTYKITATDGTDPRPDMHDRLKKLDEAVKWLLGSSYEVAVRHGKKIIYQGRKGPIKAKKGVAPKLQRFLESRKGGGESSPSEPEEN